MKRILMVAIPGGVQRGARLRTDLSYAQFGRFTWERWCRANDVRFDCVEESPPSCLAAPPPIQRWAIAAEWLSRASPDTKMAVVDADTMIRWDAPDFFEQAGTSIAAVQAGDPGWRWRSIRAYQSFFEGTELNWWNYFNSGVVVLRRDHGRLLEELVTFYAHNRAALEDIQRASNVGVDQTLLNFIVRRAGEAVVPLPPPFNLVDCCHLPPWAWTRYEENGDTDYEDLLACRFLFDFIDLAYVWHFSGNYLTRAFLMRETLRRVEGKYLAGTPGVESAGRMRHG